jgi:hypothetical protein
MFIVGSFERARVRLKLILGLDQGCQMVHFQTPNPNFGIFWKAFEWILLQYFMTFWYFLWPFVIFYAHLVHFVVI